MDWSIALKITTGILIVPLAITVHYLWPKWTKASMPVRIATSPLMLPVAGVAAVLTPWWQKM
jgi:hypothetical protein